MNSLLVHIRFHFNESFHDVNALPMDVVSRGAEVNGIMPYRHTRAILVCALDRGIEELRVSHWNEFLGCDSRAPGPNTMLDCLRGGTEAFTIDVIGARIAPQIYPPLSKSGKRPTLQKLFHVLG